MTTLSRSVTALLLSATTFFPSTLTAAENAWKLPPEKIVLKEGEGKALVAGQCILCHSTDYISTQPPLTRGQWQATVEKMRAKYGAPVQTNSIPTIVDYLTAGYGKPTPAK